MSPAGARAVRGQPIWLLWLLALAAGLGACSGDSAVTPRSEPGLHFTVRGIADTAEAVVAAPVELTLRDDNGVPQAGIAVTVTGPEGVGVTRLLSALGTPSQPSVTVTTDAAGQARVWPRLGRRVGREWIRASAGASVDSLAVDILAGQAAKIFAEPADTALWVGQSYQVRARVTDRNENPRPDAVAFTATGGAATISPTGLLTGAVIGRATVAVSAGALTATVAASVVPQAVLAVYAEPLSAGQTGGIYVIRSDGSGGRWVFPFSGTGGSPPSAGLWPTWSADGDRIAFTHGAGLRIIQADGSGIRDLVMSESAPVVNYHGLQYAKDGWIYFTRGRFGSQLTFWRVRKDGTGIAQVSEQRAWGVEASPTPSPSSDAVAYQTNDFTNSPIDFTLRFISASTGVIRKLDLRGYSPRWSPAGDRIGYLNNPDRLNFLDANGAPLGEVGGRVVPLQTGFSWSPDGAWIVGTAASGLQPMMRMVNASSGLVLPLPFRGPSGQLLLQPSWQPSP